MSWRDNLQPGSWRGVPFLFVEHEQEGGRRGELHEFPEREEPWFEDLGAKGVRISLEAVVLGADYMAKRNALQAACDVKGPGTLIHPTLGMRTLVCETYTFRESTEEGGAAFFSFEFCEAGAILPAEVAPDTGEIAVAMADEVRAAAPAVFAEDFSLELMPAWVEDAGVGLVNRLTQAAVTAGLFLGGSGSALRAFEVGLSVLPNGARTLLRAPLALADAVAGLVAAVAGLGATPTRRIVALRGLIASVNAAPAVIGATPARERQRVNQAAFQRLVTTVAAAEIVQEAADAEFASYEEAVALRDALVDEFDAHATAYADAGDDTAAGVLDGLRLVLVRDVTARGGSLARLYLYIPGLTEPALVIAHRLFGDADQVLAQADDIIARNRVIHPGFVPGGRRLEVRTYG